MVIGPSTEFLELKSTLYPWPRAWSCERHSGPSTEKHLSTYAYEPSLCSKEMSFGCTPHQTQDPVALDKQRVGRPYSLYCLDCSTWARLCPYLTPTKIVIVPNHCMRRRCGRGRKKWEGLLCPVLSCSGCREKVQSDHCSFQLKRSEICEFQLKKLGVSAEFCFQICDPFEPTLWHCELRLIRTKENIPYYKTLQNESIPFHHFIISLFLIASLSSKCLLLL